MSYTSVFLSQFLRTLYNHFWSGLFPLGAEKISMLLILNYESAGTHMTAQEASLPLTAIATWVTDFHIGIGRSTAMDTHMASSARKNQTSAWSPGASLTMNINMASSRNTDLKHQHGLRRHVRSGTSTWLLAITGTTDINISSSGISDT